MNKEFTITSDKSALYIKSIFNKRYYKIMLSSIKDIICYEIKINQTATDLKDGYISHDGDLFYRMIIETHNNHDDVELIYSERSEIVNDETIILNFVSQYQSELKAERERLLRYEMMD